MIYGITGNTAKEKLWQPAAELIDWLQGEGIPYLIDPEVAKGLASRHLLKKNPPSLIDSEKLIDASDVILSFGGDGTLLTAASRIGKREKPILGVNIGRLGFLANSEVSGMLDAIRRIEAGDYRIESRVVLEATFSGIEENRAQWALNDIVIEHSQSTELISVDVRVNGLPLTSYWADGIIISTPTGSTAYSLSVGGPILVPDSEVIVLTPLAPHTLTVRPIVLPASSVIEVRVPDHAFAFSCDGRTRHLQEPALVIQIQRAAHTVKLIQLPGQDFFQTLRTKLRWSGR